MREIPMQLITHYFSSLYIHLSALLDKSLPADHSLPTYTKFGYRKVFGPNLFR